MNFDMNQFAMQTMVLTSKMCEEHKECINCPLKDGHVIEPMEGFKVTCETSKEKGAK